MHTHALISSALLACAAPCCLSILLCNGSVAHPDIAVFLHRMRATTQSMQTVSWDSRTTAENTQR